MNIIEIFKALSNDKRVEILQWLKEPEKHFDTTNENVAIKGGVCVGDIHEKSGLSQSTISQYLAMMQKAELLESVRHGKWTYYRRNEETLSQLAGFINQKL
ncbi:metalloregulator ArsR/SmtB family transcription factor [Ignatzschineria rhizosphaerae]|uniref:Metalloregulator ArsR/SmtB family transcription factor n=1 Tax=Ignatzschineria rhizosphaerae TaxID=2923279 RepID=A0ABY3X0D0_9GAMM|nr:metalloregulator ArsR/SmtB family transcription factor [Ignatzschineria rhizosphaerae]UNM96354.1 metalloregulator ArsR/SmtB family transcription factor [Ignatzschineria rhizosphaerae]